MDGREAEYMRSLADQAASTAAHISGAVLPSVRSLGDRATAYVCRGTVCSLPIVDCDALAVAVCAKKTKSRRAGDEVGRGRRVISRLQPAERRGNAAHPRSATDES